jgi:hypothetical protein
VRRKGLVFDEQTCGAQGIEIAPLEPLGLQLQAQRLHATRRARRQRVEEFERARGVTVVQRPLDAGQLRALVGRGRRALAPRHGLQPREMVVTAGAVLHLVRTGGAEQVGQQTAVTVGVEFGCVVEDGGAALRLKLQAQRLERRNLDALGTARLLVKHQAFAPHAAKGLVRSLATAALDDARDLDQLRTVWSKLDNAERRDPFVAARASRLAAVGDPKLARTWIEPLWAVLETLAADERAAVALALVHATREAEPAWLARAEEAMQRHAQDPAVAAAAGALFAERKLWGKARPALEQAARADELHPADRRTAWRKLADLARAQDDHTTAQACDRAAAELPAT